MKTSENLSVHIEQPSFFDNALNTVAKHPFITLMLMCICSVCVFIESSDTELSAFSLFAMFTIGVGFAFFTIFFELKNKFSSELSKAVAFGCFVMIMLLVLGGIARLENNTSVVFLLSLTLAVALAVMWLWQGKLTTKRLSAIIIFLGFALKLTYIIYTTIYERQHDGGTIGSVGGHLGYITHFFDNPFALPEGDVRYTYQYYHPPLHHFIAGVVLNILKVFGYTNIIDIGEVVQYITLFYSSACMLMMYKILRFFKVDGLPLLLGLSVIAFHPTLLILSGSVNNDMLSVTFMLCAILNTLYYYRKSTYKNIIKVAVCVGCAMMSKLSGWMVAPAIAVVFVAVLIRAKKDWFKIFKQWLVFGIICVPLALWWSVRNYILYRVPFNYVLDFGKTTDMYVGNYTVLERLTDFSAYQFNSVYDQFVWYNCPYYEYNPTVGLFKTAMFDEAQYTTDIDFWAKLLFWVNVALALVAVGAMIYMLVKRTSILDKVTKAFLLLVYIIPLLSYYWFCFAYPYTCTMNIRYAVITIFTGVLFLSMAVKNVRDNSILNNIATEESININTAVTNSEVSATAVKKSRTGKVFTVVAVTLVILFCISAVIFYLLISYMPAIFDGVLHIS